MSSTLLLRIAAAAYYCLLLANSTTMVAAEQLEAGGLRRRRVQSTTSAVNRCGCMQCSDSIWSRPATDPVTLVSFTCGERIEYLISTGKSEEDACRKVAGEEFAVQCGRECNPNRCDGRYFVPNSVGSGSDSDSSFEVNTVTNDTPQYCFPEPSSRKTWDNVWGKYTVQAKEGPAPCGPGDNMFSSSLVSVNDSKDEITLRYRMENGQWTGSEVRAVLPDEERPFTYGAYSFSVKQVTVRDLSKGGAVISNQLPISLVLGMFSWDPTDDYASHENYNHEVDVEISQWNIEGNADAQFLVQPPVEPQFKRFFSGGQDGKFQQTGTWSFDWTPNSVQWQTTSGGGQTHSYSSADANYWGVPDRVQCLPADIEVRLNLWNLLGTATPTGMSENHVVEVVIDNFAYAPSGLRSVLDGDSCTRRCQCEAGSDCINGACSKPQAQSDPEEDPTIVLRADPPAYSSSNPYQVLTVPEDPFPVPVSNTATVSNPAVPVAASSSSCSAHSSCSMLAGDCCPTSTGMFLDCCDVISNSAPVYNAPQFAASVPVAIAEPVPYADEPLPYDDPSLCAMHAQCTGLAGACCPTQDGMMLDCC